MVAEAGSGPALTEPVVLAHTKRALFPDATDESYVVVDTQFAKGEWLGEIPIDDRTKDVLAPFNHVPVGTGYPDLVGVGHLDEEFLGFVGGSVEDPPFIAVEAKGYSRRQGPDVERGIFQANDRLRNANLAFVTVPVDAISRRSRMLARDLYVGLLGVETSGTVTLMEEPRVLGARPSEATEAIRLQATPQGVANQSFGLNHPKNYLAYPLAMYHPGETEEVVEEFVVGDVDSARRGAAFLGLIDARPVTADRLQPEPRLTDLGREVIRFAIETERSVESALERFDGWRRSRERFIDLAPDWGMLARFIVYSYPGTSRLVAELQRLQSAGRGELSLDEFVYELYERHPTFAIELFVRNTVAARERVFEDEDSLDRQVLREGDIYHSPTVFQLKAMLYHAGILTERGAEPSRIDPSTDTWCLRTSVG